MGNSYTFHPDALSELAEATYYYTGTPPQVLLRFAATVENAIATLVANPTRWRVVKPTGMRRCVIQRFPYAIFYQWDAQPQHVTIYAFANCYREPNYWHHRFRSDAD
jgi:hypothetical protein